MNDFIGTAEVCRILECDKATVLRRIEAGKLTPVHKLQGPNGAYVFTRTEVLKLKEETA